MLNRAYTFRIPFEQRLLSHYWHAIHLLTIAGCWFNGLDYRYRLLLTLGILLSWRWGNRLATQENSCWYLRYTAFKRWTLARNDDDSLLVSIRDGTFLSSWLIILHYRSDTAGRIKSGIMLIARQSLSEDEFRRLRVLLKLSRNDQNS